MRLSSTGRSTRYSAYAINRFVVRTSFEASAMLMRPRGRVGCERVPFSTFQARFRTCLRGSVRITGVDVPMQVVQVTRAVIGAALISLCASGTCAAQEPAEISGAEPVDVVGSPIARRSIGVSFGASDPSWHYRESGPADADKAISLEFPLHATVGLKTELGTVTWTLTRRISGQLRSDDLTATRLTLSYVGRTRPHPNVTIFWNVGGGYYHFSSGTSDLSRRHRLGAHGGAGVEVPVGERFGVGGHALYHVIPGRTLTLSRARISIHTLWLLSASVDLRLYF